MPPPAREPRDDAIDWKTEADFWGGGADSADAIDWKTEEDFWAEPQAKETGVDPYDVMSIDPSYMASEDPMMSGPGPAPHQEPGIGDQMWTAAQALGQGATANYADDLFDWMAEHGLQDDPTVGEQWRRAAEQAPYAHGVGQLGTGAILSRIAPTKALLQGGLSGLQSGLSSLGETANETGDTLSRWKDAGWNALLGFGAGAGGTLAANRVGRQATLRKPVAPEPASVEAADPFESLIQRNVVDPGVTPPVAPRLEQELPFDIAHNLELEGFPTAVMPPRTKTIQAPGGVPPPSPPTERPPSFLRNPEASRAYDYSAQDPLEELVRAGGGPRGEPPEIPFLPTNPSWQPRVARGADGRFVRAKKVPPWQLDTTRPPKPAQAPETMRPWPPLGEPPAPYNAPDTSPRPSLPLNADVSRPDLPLWSGTLQPDTYAPPAAPPWELRAPSSPPNSRFDEFGIARPLARPDKAGAPAPAIPTPAAAPEMDQGFWHDVADWAFPPSGRNRKFLSRTGRRIAGPASSVAMDPQAQQAARLAGKAAWELAGPVGADGSASAQDREQVAYADPATSAWALQSVLARGNTDLSPEDEGILTSAVTAGDMSAISAADYRLRQKYPRYAQRVEKALRGLNEE